MASWFSKPGHNAINFDCSSYQLVCKTCLVPIPIPAGSKTKNPSYRHVFLQCKLNHTPKRVLNCKLYLTRHWTRLTKKRETLASRGVRRQSAMGRPRLPNWSVSSNLRKEAALGCRERCKPTPSRQVHQTSTLCCHDGNFLLYRVSLNTYLLQHTYYTQVITGLHFWETNAKKCPNFA